LCFLLKNVGPRCNPIAVAHVAHAQAQKIASAQLAVDAEIEQGEFSQSPLHLQANPNAPNLLQLKRRFLPYQLAFDPRGVMMNLCRFQRDLLSVKEISLCARRRRGPSS